MIHLLPLKYRLKENNKAMKQPIYLGHVRSTTSQKTNYKKPYLTI